jgi:hypothetical protein
MTEALKSFPGHFCPGCGVPLRFNPRKPWYCCGACLDRATDARGNLLTFIGMSAEWCYAGDYGTDAHDSSAITVLCLLGGRPVRVSESRQGGPVAEVLHPDHISLLSARVAADPTAIAHRGIVDLISERTLDQVVARRLVTPGRKVRY